MGQNLQPVGHLALEFHNAGVVVAVQASPLQVNVAKPAGIDRAGRRYRRQWKPIPSDRVQRYVIKVPTVPPFRPDVREGDHRIVGDLLLDIKQVTVDVRRAKRLFRSA